MGSDRVLADLRKRFGFPEFWPGRRLRWPKIDSGLHRRVRGFIAYWPSANNVVASQVLGWPMTLTSSHRVWITQRRSAANRFLTDSLHRCGFPRVWLHRRFCRPCNDSGSPRDFRGFPATFTAIRRRSLLSIGVRCYPETFAVPSEVRGFQRRSPFITTLSTPTTPVVKTSLPNTSTNFYKSSILPDSVRTSFVVCLDYFCLLGTRHRPLSSRRSKGLRFTYVGDLVDCKSLGK